MFRLFLTGAENPTYCEMFRQQGVRHVGVSYASLQVRLPKKKPFSMGERFDALQVLLLGGGKSPSAFQRFVEAQIDDLTLVVEHDSHDAIEQSRTEFYDHLPPEKFVAVWHGDLYALGELAQRYEQVAVPEKSLREYPSARVRLHALAARYGTTFYGLGISRPKVLLYGGFTGASSGAWLAPGRYGETIVWDGNRIRRFQVAVRDQMRRRYRTLFERAGFDPEKIQQDDFDEVTKFTVWSLMRLEEDLARKVRRKKPLDPKVADPFAEHGVEHEHGFEHEAEDNEYEMLERDEEAPESSSGDVALRSSRGRNAVSLRPERRLLPVLNTTVDNTEIKDADGNVVKTTTKTSISPPPQSARVCDSCYVATQCPAFTPGSECAFDIPVSVSTKESLLALLRGLVEMQAQRVVFARFTEELEGGYPDPNLSSEIDRIFRLTAAMKDIEEDGSYVRIAMEAKNTNEGAGVLSRIFGSAAAQPELPPGLTLDPEQTEAYMGAVVDAEVEE